MLKHVFWVLILLLNSDLAFCQNTDFESHFFGFSQIRMKNYWNERQKNVLNFELNKIRVGLNGKIIDKLEYLVLFEGGAAAPNPYSLSPLDLHLSYKFLPELEVRAGQDWYKFGWEYSQPIPTLPFINFSDFASEVFDKMGRNGLYGYDIGIWLNGNFNIENVNLGYHAGFLNGTGLNKIDDNNKKDLFLRAYIEPTHCAHFGFSIFRGYSKILNENLNDRIYAFEFIFLLYEFMSITEFYYSQNDASKIFYDQFPKEIKKGFYSLLSYNFDPYQIFIRYELNRNLYQQEEIGNVFTIGANFYIKELNKISLNYIHRDYNSNLNNFSNQILFQMQFWINDL